jgi:hypothetical protein
MLGIKELNGKRIFRMRFEEERLQVDGTDTGGERSNRGPAIGVPADEGVDSGKSSM